ITGVITAAIITLLLRSGFDFLFASAEWAAFRDSLGELAFSSFGNANVEAFATNIRNALENAVTAFGGVLRLVRDNTASIVLSALAVIAIYLLSRFFNGLALFSFGNILNDKMSLYAETPFFAGFFRNVGTAAVYQVIYVPLAFVYDVLSLALGYALFFVAFRFLPAFFSLFLFVTFAMAAQAFKLTVVSDWMPSIIVEGKNMGQAMKGSFAFGKRNFGKAFSSFLVSCYAILAVNALLAVTTFGSALILSIPASYLFLICIQFVNYYTVRGKRYFLSYKHICDPMAWHSEQGSEETEDNK
ncbi:MAG: hypothetical protein J6Z36_04985, partial [Clostridia bacterium]|nr:hypothetical protein [Clostridia bacterium]